MEEYKELQDATLPRKPNFEMTSFCNWLKATAKRTTISGKVAWLVQGKSMRDGKDLLSASFWLDDKKCECGPVSVGKTYVEIHSDLPANSTNSSLQSLEFEK